MVEAENLTMGDNELRVMLESGLVLREAGRLDEAEKVFEGVREVAPESDVPLIALSSIAVKRNDFDRALQFCEEAMNQQSNSVFAQVNHAEILLYQKKVSDAERELTQIMKTNPADSPHCRRARLLLDTIKMIREENEI